MADGSKIEWTDATWNVVIGCDKVSPGCDHCYAIRTAHRMQANPNPVISAAYAGTEADGDWTGRVNLVTDRLDLPLKWRRPRRIFVNAQSDLFHDQVPDEFIARVWAVMASAPRHTFQVLTKRHGRMRSLLSSEEFRLAVQRRIPHAGASPYAAAYWKTWPLPNVWLGVSVEDQQRANLRIPALLDTPAAVRWISAEPLLGPVSLFANTKLDNGTLLDWVVVGGESGPGARPMHPAWARALRYECTTNGIPFLFKQWGDWGPAPWGVERHPDETLPDYRARAEAGCATHVITNPLPDGSWGLYEPDYKPWSAESGALPQEYAQGAVRRWGKRTAGRVLDGRTWDEYPAAADG